MLVFLAASMLFGLFGASPAAAAPGDSVRVFGVLRNGTDKVAGVELEAKDASGTVVGTATSSATGAWSINVPPGQYTIVINTDSLPDGVEVQKAELPVDVSGGTARPVIFSFGDVRTGTEVSAVSELTRLAIDGIRFGLIIAITGVGSAGLAMTAFPAISAAAIWPVKIASGKFQGLIAATMPRGAPASASPSAA